MSSSPIALDVRKPLGLMFAILGALLCLQGLFGDSTGVQGNVNLWWGAVLLVFGVVMLALARSARKVAAPVTESPLQS